MAKKSFFHSKGGKTVLNYAYSLGAAVVILGALFKINHLPFAKEMLFVGMGAEVVIFIISAFEPQHDTHFYEWSKVYPELNDDYLGAGGVAESGGSITQKLDSMLEEANIEQNMINKLGDNIARLSSNVSAMGDMGDAMSATADYTTNARAAANALGEVKDAYSATLSSAEGLSTTLDGLKEISNTTAAVKEQMDSLATNLSSLNGVYGNMLTAMRPQ
jgi:gliding motility-associated protein GldL